MEQQKEIAGNEAVIHDDLAYMAQAEREFGSTANRYVRRMARQIESLAETSASELNYLGGITFNGFLYYSARGDTAQAFSQRDLLERAAEGTSEYVGIEVTADTIATADGVVLATIYAEENALEDLIVSILTPK